MHQRHTLPFISDQKSITLSFNSHYSHLRIHKIYQKIYLRSQFELRIRRGVLESIAENSQKAYWPCGLDESTKKQPRLSKHANPKSADWQHELLALRIIPVKILYTGHYLLKRHHFVTIVSDMQIDVLGSLQEARHRTWPAHQPKNQRVAWKAYCICGL